MLLSSKKKKKKKKKKKENAFRGPIKYFEPAPPEFSRSDDGKRTIF